MSEKVDVNKQSDKDKRRAEHLEDRLEKKGLGHDHASKEGPHQAVEELGCGHGGSNAADETSKHANHERHRRLGSDKKAHSGQP